MTRSNAFNSDARRDFVVSSADGTLTFRMRKTPAGLLVQRERRVSRQRVHLFQSAVFKDSKPFERWLDADNARFDFPIVYTSVRREGANLLDSYGRLLVVDEDPR